ALSRRLMFYLVVFGLMLLLMTAQFIQAFIRPFHDLAANAERIADDHDVYPFESHRTGELQRIGHALARLQTRLHRHDGGPLNGNGA
ncbi:hypothetical protein J8J40_21170, partial [Mycobacterium tuberculosis]|nr:hypothetical protein [Mycobacterium tuberculosis]